MFLALYCAFMKVTNNSLNSRSKTLLVKYICAFMCLLVSSTLFGQITTSEIKGYVTSPSGDPVPEVKVTIVHEPTGRVVFTRTDLSGIFFAPQLTPGGPYTVSVDFVSFKPFTASEIYVTLGETKLVEVRLEENITELETVTVIGDKDDAFSNKRKGTETNIGAEEIGKLPTLNRSLQDMTRNSPQAAGNSYVGSNYRYNNLSIDGVANNDAFGFQEPSVGAGGSTAAGSPGALAGTQPISLDAVSEIQVATAPYDVKLGNFTGGSLNVVTKSGTNTLSTSIYTYGRNNSTTGRSPFEAREKIERFYNIQSGFSVGGALKKNRLFFFVNAEIGRSSSPLLFAPGTEGSVFALQDIAAISDTLKQRYNYDAGTFGDGNTQTINNKLFLRFDYILNEKHSLTLRHNVVQASHENLTRSGTIFNFGSQGFTHNSITNSTVAELKSRFKKNRFNNLIVGFNKIHDFREPFSELFPHIEITYKSAGQIFLGSYREASIFQMNQSTLELSDNFNLYLNKHKITFGTHNELYLFKYHFVTPYTGRWAYASLEDFYAELPSRVRGTYNLADDSYEYNYNRPSADFPVLLTSVYVQDEYTPNKRLSISYGVRLEGNIFTNEQNVAADVAASPSFGQYANGVTPKFIVAPRVGFNYDLTGDKKWKLRGGSGIFAGRMPFAWAAYSYIYNGTQFGSVDVRPTTVTPLITDDYGQLATLQANKREVNLVAPDFKLPRVWRSSLATDIKLPGEFVFTLEGIFTKTIYDALFQSLNLKDSTVALTGAGNDDRPVYVGSGDAQRVDPNYANVFLLKNTTLGYKYSIAASLRKKFGKHLNAMVAYTLGESKDVVNGVRVSAQANWEWTQTIEANNPQLSYSNFDIRHRIIANMTYDLAFAKRHKTTLGLFFIANSGTPFSYVYAGDLNRDASSNNDLIYVPRDASEINLVNIVESNGNIISAADQWTQLDAYISNDPYLNSKRGQVTERNGGRTPWNIQVDMHLGQEYAIKGKNKAHRIELTADVFNILNLFNYNWGRQYFVPNTTNAGYALLTAKTTSNGATTTYQFFNPTSTPWQIDGIASRLQMQVGLRYSF